MSKILITDDDTSFGLMIEGFLKRKGFTTKYASSFKTSAQAITENDFDLILTDYRLDNNTTGLELLPLVKKQNKNTPLILITAYSDIRVAVNAIKLGAYEYITKPVNPEELLHVINRALNTSPKKEKKESKLKTSQVYIKGISKYALETEEQIELIAPTELSVLILGESGVGKEYIAKRIHELSPRNNAPFVAVDCGALQTDIANSELFGHKKGSFTGALEDKKGHFEEVKDGTIFLDEIGNLSYDVQIKLLRAIQERKARKLGGNEEYPISCRIIAATNENLRESSFAGKFREDLYHRLNEFSIHIFPLRQRKEDILFYSLRFLDFSSNEFEKENIILSQPVKEILQNYEWPGNLRELKNVIRRAVLLTRDNEITVQQLPNEIQTPLSEEKITVPTQLNEAKEQSEKEIIINTLEQTKYNKAKTARILGIDRKTLYNKLHKYNIEF